MPIVGLVGPLVTWVIAGLDERLRWLPQAPPPLQLLGFLVVAAGSALPAWAMTDLCPLGVLGVLCG